MEIFWTFAQCKTLLRTMPFKFSHITGHGKALQMSSSVFGSGALGLVILELLWQQAHLAGRARSV